MAERVVRASGAGFELIRMEIRVCGAFLTYTLALTPRVIPKPPPLEPIRVGSVNALPAGSVSHTSKKLDIAAGLAASETGKDVLPTGGILGRFAWNPSQAGEGGDSRSSDWRCQNNQERNL